MFARLTSVMLFTVCASVSGAQMGPAFDAASLDNALKGMRVYKARMTEIVAMRVQFMNVQNHRSDAQTKGEKEIQAYENRQNQYRECLSEKLHGNDQAKAAKMQEKVMGMMSNAAAMQKYSELGQAVATAAQKGDTAAMYKANLELMKFLGMDPKADSAAAATACGGTPKRPQSVIDVEQLERQADSITIKLRRAENAAEGDASRAAGVAPSRFAEMRERLTTYANNPSQFTGAEAALLLAHKAEIVALTKSE